MDRFDRRKFLTGIAALGLLPQRGSSAGLSGDRISIHQRSLKSLFDAGALDPIDYAKFSADKLSIRHVEYEEPFYAEHLREPKYWKDLSRRSRDAGVSNEGFLCGPEHSLDSPDSARRESALEHHKHLLAVSVELGVKFIRVRCSFDKPEDKEVSFERARDGVGKFCELAKGSGVAVLLENIQGFSRDAAWLVRVVEAVGEEKVGLLADFGNFEGDRYAGLAAMLPHLKSACAKSAKFSPDGRETSSDYARMVKMIEASGYRGLYAVEYVGSQPGGIVGTELTKALLVRSLEAIRL